MVNQCMAVPRMTNENTDNGVHASQLQAHLEYPQLHEAVPRRGGDAIYVGHQDLQLARLDGLQEGVHFRPNIA